MNINDREFVKRVNVWRKQSSNEQTIIDFLDELKETISDDNEISDDFDDGFDMCILYISHEIKKIIKGEENGRTDNKC